MSMYVCNKFVIFSTWKNKQTKRQYSIGVKVDKHINGREQRIQTSKEFSN